MNTTTTQTVSATQPSGKGQDRTCFVIMPFSKSKTCTEGQWTGIFEKMIKPAIEASGYHCRRSTATRGNLIKEIIQDLDASWVVLADLTDKNPNVFYELGVRHALKDRTILIAQNRDDIPFDLQSYASHVYDWKTEDGKKQFSQRIGTLLADVDQNPNRADNPVSDFLEIRMRNQQPTVNDVQLDELEKRVNLLEGAYQSLKRRYPTGSDLNNALSDVANASPFDEEKNVEFWFDAGQKIVEARDARALRGIVRKSTIDIRNKIPPKVEQLNSLRPSGPIKKNQVLSEALKFEKQFVPITQNIDNFALGLVSVDWAPAARSILQIAGSLISSGKGLSGLRFTIGLPAFFGWRLLLICGARSVQQENFSVTNLLINGPIPVVGTGMQMTYRSLTRHRDLFYPEAFLGYADLAIRQFESIHEHSPHVQDVFGSKGDFLASLGEFLILLALRAVGVYVNPLYPGYRLLTGFQEACQRLTSRLITDPDQLNAIAKIFELSGTQLKDSWPELAAKANSADLGHGYLFRSIATEIPTKLGSEE